MRNLLERSWKIAKKRRIIEVARGDRRADIVLKNVQLVNVLTEEVYESDIAFCDNIIAGVGRYSGIKEFDCRELFAVPGLIDAHTHIEMTMLSLSEFSRLVVNKGTTAVVADPHEIANVFGVDGIKMLIEESKSTPLRFYCLIPSCVPSSKLETAGAEIGVKEIKELMKFEQVLGLAEVMNYPGVLNCEDDILQKILAAEGKIVDGHCPLLSGEKLNAYISAGVYSDHESTRLEEAKEKLRLGMRIMIREGSAARNLRALKSLIPNRYLMLVTDGDRSVLDIINEGYLDYVYRRAIEEGIDEFHTLQMLTINPAEYFGINAGLIAPGRFADVVLLKNLKKFEVKKVFVDGKIPEFKSFEYPEWVKKSVKAKKITLKDVELRPGKARVIVVYDGEIITGEIIEEVKGIDVSKDILKALVVERHGKTSNISKAYVKGFGLKRGAIAQTIAHDAHNIVAVGASDEDICKAVNSLIDIQGGIVVCDGKEVITLPLRIGGLMSDERAEVLAEKLEKVENKIKELGCNLKSPIISLSFIALPVIPKLKLTDLGLVDVEKFEIVDVFVSGSKN
ncbi:MAG: adenine deaminase [Archaeoglobales archaeon]|nr:adenine deaminase [Archaeoglobales archaeon]